MAQQSEGKKIPHRDRKNPRSAEFEKERRQEKNAERGRQVYDIETKTYSRIK